MPRLNERLDALGPAPRAELLHVLMPPDFERADRIGESPDIDAAAEFVVGSAAWAVTNLVRVAPTT